MTDKQIIIDGVAVDKCEFYGFSNWGNHICCPREFNKAGGCIYCNDNPNCYYKQLKRKEQECEAYKMEAEEGYEINVELKAKNETLFKAIEEVNKINKRLEFEKEELKEQLTILDDEDVVVEITVKQFEEYKKLKQTLAEIKEIAQYDVYTSRTDLCLKLNWIKKKTNEVEDDN